MKSSDRTTEIAKVAVFSITSPPFSFSTLEQYLDILHTKRRIFSALAAYQRVQPAPNLKTFFHLQYKLSHFLNCKAYFSRNQ